MKTSTAWVAGLLLATGLIAPAHAFTPGGAFTLVGPANINGLPCTPAVPVAGTAGGGGTITSVAFTGSPVCTLVHATGLPWTMTPTSTTSVQLSPVGLTFSSACGPATVTANWSNASGQLSLSSAAIGSCVLSWTLSSSPPQTLP